MLHDCDISWILNCIAQSVKYWRVQCFLTCSRCVLVWKDFDRPMVCVQNGSPVTIRASLNWTYLIPSVIPSGRSKMIFSAAVLDRLFTIEPW